MEKKTRRQYTPEEKVRLLRLHLLEGKPVSTICEEAGIHPTLFYQWQRTFFENGSAAFSSPPNRRQRHGEQDRGAPGQAQTQG